MSVGLVKMLSMIKKML